MLKKSLLVAGLAAALLGGPAAAEEIRISPAAPPAHPANGTLYTNFMKYLPEESGGRLTATMLGPEVVKLLDMKDALQSQVTQVGNFLPLYFPSDLPNTSLAGDLALSGRNPQAMASALTEYVVNCADCQAEYKKMGTAFFGAGSSDVYLLMTTKPVKSLDDLKGLRLRSGGAPWSRWAEAVGATPVNISVFEVFEAMSQGTIDGTMASIFDLLAFRLIELVKDATTLELGTYHTTSNFTAALPLWQSLSVEDRKAFVRAANRANADFTDKWGFQNPKIAHAKAKEAGITYIDPDAAMVSFTEQFIKDDLPVAAKVSEEKFGVKNAEEKLKTYRALVEKWTKIAEANGNDPVKIAAEVQKEVWDKIDYATYGM